MNLFHLEKGILSCPDLESEETALHSQFGIPLVYLLTLLVTWGALELQGTLELFFKSAQVRFFKFYRRAN